MKPNRNNLTGGFTLVELLIVVALVGLLSTLIFVSITNARLKSFDTRRLADMNNIQKGLTLYSADFESYPSGNRIILGDVNYQCLSTLDFTPFCPPGERVYMARVPQNPQPTEPPYYYTSVDNGSSYTLEFYLITTIGDMEAGYHVLTPDGIQ
jgi:prepilin-type N-terminal cleavage/methylation domain-containing protein